MSLTPAILLRVIDSADALTPAQIRELAEAVARAVEQREPARGTSRDLAAWATGVVLDSDCGNPDALQAAEDWARAEYERASRSGFPEDEDAGRSAAAFLAALEAFGQAVRSEE